MPDIKQSKWEEFVKKVLLTNKCGYLRFEVKKLLDSELAERDKQWLSCLPEGEHITTAHTYRKRILNNAKKLSLIK